MEKCPFCSLCDYPSRRHEPNGSACLKRQRRDALGGVNDRDGYYAEASRKSRLNRDDNKHKDPSNLKASLIAQGGTFVEPGRSCRHGSYVARAKTNDKDIVGEIASYNSLLSRIKAGEHVLDIGGCIGSMAIEAALRGAKVTTLEPDVEHIKRLHAHIHMNKVKSRVVVRKVLMSKRDAPSMRVLHKTLGPKKGNHSTLIKSNTRGNRRPELCKTISSLKLVQSIGGPIAHLKVDVEGDEHEWWHELWRALDKRSLRTVAMEIHLSKKAWKANAKRIVSCFRGGAWKTLKKPVLGPKHWATVGVWARG